MNCDQYDVNISLLCRTLTLRECENVLWTGQKIGRSVSSSLARQFFLAEEIHRRTPPFSSSNRISRSQVVRQIGLKRLVRGGDKKCGWATPFCFVLGIIRWSAYRRPGRATLYVTAYFQKHIESARIKELDSCKSIGCVSAHFATINLRSKWI